MKPEMRTAGIFASGTFIGIAVYSYWGTQDPVYAVIYSSIAAAAMGLVGYHIGNILAHPKGYKQRKASKSSNKPETPRTPISGDETLFEDLPA